MGPTPIPGLTGKNVNSPPTTLDHTTGQLSQTVYKRERERMDNLLSHSVFIYVVFYIYKERIHMIKPLIHTQNKGTNKA